MSKIKISYFKQIKVFLLDVTVEIVKHFVWPRGVAMDERIRRNESFVRIQKSVRVLTHRMKDLMTDSGIETSGTFRIKK